MNEGYLYSEIFKNPDVQHGPVATIMQPAVILADEPTGNLDPETSEGIMLLLERINRTGTTVIMATHDYHIVDSMRRRVIELNGGQLTRDQSRGVYGVGR